MRLIVTEKGIYDAKGVMLEKGAAVEVDGDEIPASMINKVRLADSGEKGAKKFVANPAAKGGKKPNGEGIDDLKAQAAELGIENIDGMSAEDLQAAIDAKLAE